MLGGETNLVAVGGIFARGKSKHGAPIKHAEGEIEGGGAFFISRTELDERKAERKIEYQGQKAPADPWRSYDV